MPRKKALTDTRNAASHTPPQKSQLRRAALLVWSCNSVGRSSIVPSFRVFLRQFCGGWLVLLDEPVSRIRRQARRLRQAKLLADDVRAADDGDHLVEGDPPAHAFTAEAAVARDGQPLERDVFERAPNQS